jgi:hypothetical protein
VRVWKSVSHGHVPRKDLSYIEVFKDEAVEEVGVAIPQVAEVDVLLDRGRL